MINKHLTKHKFLFLLFAFPFLSAFGFSDSARNVTMRLGFGTYGYSKGTFKEKQDAFSVQLNLQAKIGKKTWIESDFHVGTFHYRNEIIPGTDWQSQFTEYNYSLLYTRQLLAKGRFSFLGSIGLCFVHANGTEPHWKTDAYVDTAHKPAVTYIDRFLEEKTYSYNSVSMPIRVTINYKLSRRLSAYLTLNTYFEPDVIINYFRGTSILFGFGYRL